MKRIIYCAAIAALLVTSCQKTDVLNVAEDTIDFSTQVGKLTKVGEPYDKLATLKSQDFRVWAVADFDQSPDAKGDIYRGMENLTVRYEGNEWGIVTENNQRYFWPQADYYLYFYTISAKDTDWLDGINYKTTEDNHFNVDASDAITGLTLPKFTLSDVADDDVMVSNHIRQTKKSTTDQNASKTVRPYFRHTMTKVEFNFRKGGEEVNPSPIASTVVLKSISISEVFDAGVLNVTYGDDFDFVWEPLTTKANFSYDAPIDAYITNSDEIRTFIPAYDKLPEVGSVGAYCKVGDAIYIVTEETVEGEVKLEWTETDVTYSSYNGKVLEATDDYTNYVTWYMIPQGLKDSQVVTITYVADGKTITQDFALTVDNNSDKDWTEETCVKYNVTIAPHKVVFNPVVDPWKEFDADKGTPGNQDVEMEN